MSTSRCNAPVTVSDFFPTGQPAVRRECVRAAGHDGAHRWQERWEALPPGDVEAELAREAAVWDDDDSPGPRST